MGIYHSKYNQANVTSYTGITSLARAEYHAIQKLTPRREAYIRSRYFSSDKVFVNQMWEHLKQKRISDRVRRLRLYSAGLDLARNSMVAPTSVLRKDGVVLHRFEGITKNGHKFAVQIRESATSGRKDLMSVFPIQKTNQ